MKLADGFVWSMLVAVLLALWRPDIGSDGGLLHLGAGIKFGIALLFFLNGASVSLEKLRAGAGNWRLHAVVLSFTYLLFPLLGFMTLWATPALLPPDLQLGIIYLCVLSSAVSSSVAMTAVAGGNVSAAICSATLSTLLGLLLTPLWVGVFLRARTAAPPLGDALADIAVHLLLPFLLGQLSRPLIAAALDRHRKFVNRVDRTVIVFIVYNAFCDSTQAGVWRGNAWALVTVILGIDIVFLAAAIWGAKSVARRLGFDRQDEAATVFCASKKSVINGVPMAKLIFGSGHALGLILLPVMLYHQLQLIVCAVLARRYAAEGAQLTGSNNA